MMNSRSVFLRIPLQFGQVQDERDGREYRTVSFDNGPRWLAQNLEFEGGQNSWPCAERSVVDCGQCYTFRGALAAADGFGRGWRIPSDSDWQQLLMALGGYFDRSHKPAIAVGNPEQTRNYLFHNRSLNRLTLSRGGFRSHVGRTAASGRWQGVYWSADAEGSQQAWCYAFTNGRYCVYRFAGFQRNAYAVRLIEA